MARNSPTSAASYNSIPDPVIPGGADDGSFPDRGDGDEAQILEGQLALSEEALARLPRIDMAEAYYEKRLNHNDLGDLFDGTSDTRFGYRLGVVPLSQVTVTWEVAFTYEPDDMGGFRRRRTLNLQSRMNF